MKSIPNIESGTVELKSKPAGLEREIVAFANAKGGTIVIGVDDHGNPAKFEITNRIRSQIVDAIENCQPRPDFHLEEQDGVLLLHIEEGEKKPYRAPEGFFLRIGASSRKLNRDEIIKFFIDENRISFDSQVRSEVFNSLESELFSPSLFGVFRERSKLEAQTDDLSLLANLQLIHTEKNITYPTNALVLLFSRSASKVFPQARTIIWEMSNETSILDQRIITGDLFSQLSQSLALIEARLKRRYVIEKLTRDEITEFPSFVLRELLVNALIHRDYFERGAEIQIKIYPDRVEISNPGKLLYGVKTESLIGRSLRRNPILAEIFHRAGLVERAGTGLIRVQNLLQEQNLAPIKLKEEGEFFIAILMRHTQLPEDDKIKMNSRQSKTINLLKQKKYITSAEYASKYQLSDRLARKELAELVRAKLIERIREGREIKYRLL